MENINDSNLFEPNLLKDRYLKEVKIFKLCSVYMIFYCIFFILTFFMLIFFMAKDITKMPIIDLIVEWIYNHIILMLFFIAVIAILLFIGLYFFIFKPYLYFYRQKEIGSIIKIDKDRKRFNIVIKCQRWLIIYLLFSIITGFIVFAIEISPLFKITVFTYICLFFTFLCSFMYVIPFLDLYTILFYLQCYKVWKLRKIILINNNSTVAE